MTDGQFTVCVAGACWAMGAGFAFTMRFLWAHSKPSTPLSKLLLTLIALTMGWTFALDAFFSWLRGLPPEKEDP